MFSFVNMENELKQFFEKDWYLNNKYSEISGRYLTNLELEKFIKSLNGFFSLQKIGSSVKGIPIYKFVIGAGKIKILAWSQMHGNESTTTKALFDLLHSIKSNPENSFFKNLLQAVKLELIPILNPDGAEAYTRVNANQVDLNRDMQKLSQPESRLLKQQFDKLQPDFCLNLHDQRTIFSAGEKRLPATLSFLTPSMDKERSLDEYRKRSMGLISKIAKDLGAELQGRIGRYDDAFNINCAGDTFQYNRTPTLLFEAGHYEKDYEREEVRRFVFLALISCLHRISSGSNLENFHEEYFAIPENKKLFNDVVIRRAGLDRGVCDISIQFKEELKGSRIEFIPFIEKIASEISNFGHREINANEKEVRLEDNSPIIENVVVNKIILNNEKLEVKYR